MPMKRLASAYRRSAAFCMISSLRWSNSTSYRSPEGRSGSLPALSGSALSSPRGAHKSATPVFSAAPFHSIPFFLEDSSDPAVLSQALGRLSEREAYDRAFRLRTASMCSIAHEELPKEKWVKPEEVRSTSFPSCPISLQTGDGVLTIPLFISAYHNLPTSLSSPSHPPSFTNFTATPFILLLSLLSTSHHILCRSPLLGPPFFPASLTIFFFSNLLVIQSSPTFAST
jgi:hypothetical protein